MKKGIIVLLIAVLVSGFAFADLVTPGKITGSAGIEFSVDLNDKDSNAHAWGFANPRTAKYSFKFEFDSAKVAIGEDHQTDIWAELAAEASSWISLSNATGAQAIAPAYSVKIKTANIHIGEITIGILNSGKAVDYAASYYKTAAGAPENNKLGGESQLAPGFTVDYKGWYGGFGATGDWKTEGNADDNVRTIWGHGKTQSFELADGLTAEAGGYAVIGADKYIGGGLKVDYASDKLTAGIAGDGALKKGDVNFGLEGAIYAQYAFAEEGAVRLDIYGASKDYIPYYAEDDFLLKLDAMVSAGYKFTLSDDIVLDVNGFVDVRDIVNSALTLTVGAEESTSIDRFDLYASEAFMAIGLADADIDPVFMLLLDFKVTYNHEKFKAWAEIEPSFLFDADENTDTFATLEFNCGISSDAIIEGAVLKLVYKDVDFLDFENNKGNITASCTISF